jgi:hypothetical protein
MTQIYIVLSIDQPAFGAKKTIRGHGAMHDQCQTSNDTTGKKFLDFTL